MTFAKKLVLGITAPQSSILLQGQLRYFVDKGYEVFLLAPKDAQTIALCQNEGATLLPIRIKCEISLFFDVLSFFQILSILKRVKPDIVNLGTPKISLLGLIAAKFVGIKTRIYTCRGFRFEHETGFFQHLLIFAEKRTASAATKVFSISESVKALGLENKIFSEDKTIVIHKGSSNGVDLTLFNQDSIDPKKLQDLKLILNLKDKFVFGYLGRIIKRKGFKELVHAFDRLYQQDKAVRLIVVGRPYYDQIDKETIAKATAHPGILMLGLIENTQTPYYYALMDVFVLPAYWEGFGNVLLEAAAMGIPTIATDVTGCKDAVVHKTTGELIAAKNANSLKQTMLKFQNNPQLREKYAKDALLWVQNFKPEIIWKGIEDIYTEKGTKP